MPMKTNQMYDFSDAWFLTALLLLNDWSDMEQIISAGDVINHAIFMQEEMNQALQRLIPAGYIITDADKYRATEKAHELTACSAYKRAGLFTLAEVILKRLNSRKQTKKRNE